MSLLVEAETFKQKGNSFYKVHNFAKANEAYTKALKKLNHKNNKQDDMNMDGNNDKILALCVALYSNRGNARFELGDYEGAAEDSRDVIEIISDPDGTRNANGTQLDEERIKKIEMNKWRLVRCLFYLNADGTEAETKTEAALKEIVSSITDPSLEKKCKKILDSMDYNRIEEMKISGNMKVAEGRPKHIYSYNPQLTRSNLSFPYCEYYPFGHDFAESALHNMNGKRNSTVNVLYGGVGDGRHVFATILDAHYRNEKKDAAMKLHVAMNDINATLLLKDVVVLVLMHRIGSSLSFEMCAMDNKTTTTGTNNNSSKSKEKKKRRKANSENILKDLEGCEEAYLMMTVLYYGTLTYAMPPPVYNKLQSLLNEIIINETCKSFNEKYPWLHIPDNAWSKLHHDAKHWVDISMFHPPLASVEEYLTIYAKPNNQNDSEKLEAIGAMGFNDSMEDLKHKKAEEDERDRNMITALVDRMVDGDPSVPLPNELSVFIPRNGTKEEMDNAKKLLVTMIMKMQKDGIGDLELDLEFLKGTSALLPPVGLTMDNIPEMKELRSMCDTIQELFDRKDSASQMKATIQDVEGVIHRTWRVNPMKFCPDWQKWFLKNSISTDETNPVKEFPKHFCHEDIHEMLLHTVSGSFAEMQVKNRLFDLFALFYVNVSCAIAKLVQNGKLSLEISLASILDFANEISYDPANHRKKLNLPVSFQEVFLSNVPDYTGFLSCLVQIGPILNKNADVPSQFRSNVALNNGMFQHYDQYVYGSTALSVKGLSRILRTKCMEEDPGVWNGFNRWATCEDGLLEKPVTYLEFKAWVHRLFLTTTLPPVRDSHKIVREEHPNTMDLFLWTCKYCIAQLNYPIHWVTNSLESLLANAIVKTKATMNNSSPTSFPLADSKTSRAYNLSCVQLELRNQLSVFASCGILPCQFLSVDQQLPKGKPVRYTLDIETSWIKNAGNPHVSCIGFLLEKRKDHNYEIMGGGMLMFGRGPKPLVDLRESLLRKGESVGHLFSTGRYNFKSGELSFTLCEDIFKKYGDYYLSLVRTDCWGTINHDVVKLNEAIVSSI